MRTLPNLGPQVWTARPRSSAFDPLSLLPKLWLRGDDCTAGAITAWADQSGNDFGPTTGTATAVANVKNGHQVVRFNGTTDFLRTGTAHNVAQPDTICVAFQSTNDQRIFDGSTADFRQLAQRFNNWGYYAGNGVESGAANDTRWYVLTCVFNGASSKLRANGVDILAGNPGSLSIDLITLGADNAGASPLAGDIAEVLVLPAALSAGSIGDVEGYLNDKYAIY